MSENKTIDSGVDIGPEPQQVPDAEDMYSVNTYLDELGYDRKTLNMTLITGDSCIYLEISVSMFELSWSEGDMYARGMHVAIEKSSYSTRTREIEVSLKKKMRSLKALKKE